MKLSKNNCKVIIAFILGLILAGGIVYAATSASQVSYTKEGIDVSTVEDALNDLYKNKQKKSDEIKYITSNGEHILLIILMLLMLV